jgi:tetratricopeptide (TPR) repeat protein
MSLMFLLIKEGLPEDLRVTIAAGGYRVVANTYDNAGGCFVMWGSMPVPGEKAVLAQGQTEPASRIRPQSSDVHLEQAYAYQEKSKFSDALRECELAIQLAPAVAEAHNLRGMMLEELGQKEAAIAAYREAVRLDPAFHDAQENLLEAESELHGVEQKKGETKNFFKNLIENKNPWLAGLLNFIIPGLGQAYIGNWWRGIGTFAITAVGLVILRLFVVSYVLLGGSGDPTPCANCLLVPIAGVLFWDGYSWAVGKYKIRFGRTALYIIIGVVGVIVLCLLGSVLLYFLVNRTP